ncbi:hypothetical protein [Aquiflexum lacus]|uniref:hypothetical protein n=1 Tax=Aquiflexum lacus TaxID=2483805 RepID=UPI0018942B7F|nr:hypothetical protein [Aquiflexum lacus]
MKTLQVYLEKDIEYMKGFSLQLRSSLFYFNYKPVYVKWGMIIYLLLLQNPAS